ncbi:MAG: hypothetical protein ACYC2X_08670, partial [Coriobacteriia bacterium]
SGRIRTPPFRLETPPMTIFEQAFSRLSTNLSTPVDRVSRKPIEQAPNAQVEQVRGGFDGFHQHGACGELTPRTPYGIFSWNTREEGLTRLWITGIGVSPKKWKQYCDIAYDQGFFNERKSENSWCERR